jgi:membrane protein
VLSFALVLACVIGRACAQDEGVLGRVIRGRDDSVTWQTV